MTVRTIHQQEADLRAALTTLAERYEQMAKPTAPTEYDLFVDEVSPTEVGQTWRVHTYRKAAADIRDVLRTGRIPHDLMTDAELEQHGTHKGAAS